MRTGAAEMPIGAWSNTSWNEGAHCGNFRTGSGTSFRKHADPPNTPWLKFSISGRTVFARAVHQRARKENPFPRIAAAQVDAAGYDFLLPLLEKEVGEKVARKIVKEVKVKVEV